MLRLSTIILIIVFFPGCNGNSRSANNNLGPVQDSAKKTNEQPVVTESQVSGCSFLYPDTSLAGITLREPNSTIAIIGDKDKYYEDEKYYYYSKNWNETLSLTQHPGDGKYTISIFKVELSDKADHGYRKLNIEKFISEKGIQLGLSKKQIIDKLGTCYTTKDSTKGYINLYYRLVEPDKSAIKLLIRHNMPIYYASYKLWNDKLQRFEFGFEYP